MLICYTKVGLTDLRRAAVLRWSTPNCGLVVNVVPSHSITCTSCSGFSDGENEPLVKCFLQQLQHLFTFLVVWQIRLSASTLVPHSWILVFFLPEEKR